MKKTAFGRGALLLLFLILILGFIGMPAYHAAAYDTDYDDDSYDDDSYDLAYGFEITSYLVNMTVDSNRSIEVEEVISVHLMGTESHGIIRDFPLANGITYSNLNATCEHPDFHPYLKTDDAGYLSFYLRGYRLAQGEYRTYTVTYTMQVPALKEKGYLPLDVIGFDWQCKMQNVAVRVNFPDGLLKYQVFTGLAGTTTNSVKAEITREGNTIWISAGGRGKEALEPYNGITLDLSFEAGVLSSPVDMAVLYVILIGLALLGGAILLKLLAFRQPTMVTSVNLEAPEQMDPLKMGKLIDNQIDSEDLGAVIFYLADKGYLHIDFTEDRKNPTLYKTSKPMEGDLPDYIVMMYEGLFSRRESVRMTELKNSFYRTSERVIGSVNAQNKNLVNQKTMNFGLIYGIISIVVFVLFGLFYSLSKVGQGYLYWMPVFICVFSFALPFVLTLLVRQRQYKWKKPTRMGVLIAGIVLGVIISLLLLLMPSAAFSKITSLLFGLFTVAIGVVCGFFMCRTKEYTETLGRILGFKEFITVTERDKIAFMLQENPELYYHILPYAQVLGVTDQWTDKFKGLDMKPPRYASYNSMDAAFDIMIWHSLCRSFHSGMAHNMVSSPSSSGNGRISGGFGGGHGGGGFGGGGGRGC